MGTEMELVERISKLEDFIKVQNEELELLHAAINLSEVGFTLSDANGVVVKINQSQIKITGHEPNKTLGRSMSDIEIENFNQSATMQVIKTKSPVTIEQILPSGKSYLVYGKPYFTEDGDLKYVICNLIDNTQHNYERQELEIAKTTNRKLKETVQQLKEIVDMNKNLVYSSKKMQGLISICDKVAYFDSTILILGQSGVGKELIADYIFKKSSRAKKIFVKINCAAIPDSLLESELFGYDPGAFTNAYAGGKKGILETANGGTVLLDEVGDLPLHLQSKLLRVLQEGEFYHVGGTIPIHVDVRIIASTNRDLENMANQGLFRKDLYYRLSVIKIAVPSLEERREDIPMLIRHFLSAFNNKYNLKKDLTFDAMEYLKKIQYPGNIRDLQNVIERVLLLAHNNTISCNEVEMALNSDYNYYGGDITTSKDSSNVSLKGLLSHYEKDLLQKYWEEYKSASKMAEILKTNQPTISRKLHAYRIL